MSPTPAALLVTLTFSLGFSSLAAAEGPDRTRLPVAEPPVAKSTIMDVRDAPKPALPFRIQAPAGAPNVVIILIDDMGFGQPSTFGGPIRMPTMDRLAANGLRFNHFHTTALCSPSRMALLTGRNHHSVNTGSIMETATAYPGNTGRRPDSVAPLAKTLRYNGYSTAQFGKNHETPAYEISVSGPTDQWPVRSGFDYFYGFMAGETNQWFPAIYEGTVKIEVPHDSTYHFTTDMTNKAITWVRSQKSLTPEKPFFVYFAPGATHAPHHAPKEWIEKYRGKFDAGWDVMRAETLQRQIKLGVVPVGTKLAPKPAAIKDWDALDADAKRLFARQMEVFAGFAEHTDVEIGRLITAIEKLGQLDNTIIYYIAGDNGASAEGGMNGLHNEISFFNGMPEAVADILPKIDELGGPMSYGHFAAGWAVAGNAPFAWTKQVASSYGGTRNGTVVHWPKAITAKGEVRQQWSHLIDVAPTILEAAKLPHPTHVDGIPQAPIEGVSMAYAFADAKAAERHQTQYFEIFGNRAIYHQGFLAGTVHRAPWEAKPRGPFAEDVWELYDTRTDFSLVNDLAKVQPEKLKEMQALFLTEAAKYSALPLDDRVLERFVPALAGRPDLLNGRTTLAVYPGMIGLSENVFLNVKNTSHRIVADLDIPASGANGVIIAQAGRFGGWSFYLKNGIPTYGYNFVGRARYQVQAKQAVPAGAAKLRVEFAYDGGGMGKGATVRLFNGETLLAEGRIDHTVPIMFSGDEGVDVGEDGETPVVEDYGIAPPYKFTGTIEQVTVTVLK